MIKVENIEVFNFEGAIRGMRNPMNSWNKSDSRWCDGKCELSQHAHCLKQWDSQSVFFCVGDNDLKLMNKLFSAGTEHRKFMRQIFVSMDITAPLFWWKEFDTYKVGATANSCSTMHTLHKRNLELSDFSCETLDKLPLRALSQTINVINGLREEYVKTKDKHLWREMIELLPSSFEQKRTVTMTYENVASMIKQRSGHKLYEWNDFVGVLKNLPYIEEIMYDELDEEHGQKA